MKKKQFSIKWLFGIMVIVAIVSALFGWINHEFGLLPLLAACLYVVGFSFVAILLFGRKMYVEARTLFEESRKLNLAKQQSLEAFAKTQGASKSAPKPKHPLDD